MQEESEEGGEGVAGQAPIIIKKVGSSGFLVGGQSRLLILPASPHFSHRSPKGAKASGRATRRNKTLINRELSRWMKVDVTAFGRLYDYLPEALALLFISNSFWPTQSPPGRGVELWLEWHRTLGNSGRIRHSPPPATKIPEGRHCDGGGHHGGSWKVAFADFVTAMMALFMVLWLMNVNQETQEAVAAYFNDPKWFGEKWGSGKAGSGGGLHVGKEDLEGLAAKIEQALSMPEFAALKDQVVSTVTGEGLRIELLENENGTFFNSGRPQPSSSGRQTLSLIAAELEKLPNEIIMEGHTDSRPFHGRKNYSNWELSADRANSARRILIEAGLPAERIVQVRGFADVALRKPETPEDPTNRRISLIVRYSQEPPAADAEAASDEEQAQAELAPEDSQPHEPDPTEAGQEEPDSEGLPEDLSVLGEAEGESDEQGRKETP